MEKIFLLINARSPDFTSLDFACRIAAITHSRLTGLFIENLYAEYIPTNNLEVPSYFEATKKSGRITQVLADTEQSIRLFKEECQRHSIENDIYVDKGEPIQEAIYESRFADLLIMKPGISFYDSEEELPSHLVKEILAAAECPVLLAPEKFEAVEEIVFCYDSNASSVFAIKQFTYLFPELTNRKAMLLEVNRSGKEEFNEDHRRIMVWMRSHYQSVCYHALKGDVKDEMFTYFFMKQKRIIVLGAYGRSLLSNFFKKSNADILIRTVDLPLFITHH